MLTLVHRHLVPHRRRQRKPLSASSASRQLIVYLSQLTGQLFVVLGQQPFFIIAMLLFSAFLISTEPTLNLF